MKKDSELIARQRTILTLTKTPDWQAFKAEVQYTRDEVYAQLLATDPSHETGIATLQGKLTVCEQILRIDEAIEEDMRRATEEQSSG